MVRRRGDDIVGPPRVFKVSPTHLTNAETGELIENLFVKKKVEPPAKETEPTKSERPEGGTPDLPITKREGSS